MVARLTPEKYQEIQELLIYLKNCPNYIDQQAYKCPKDAQKVHDDLVASFAFTTYTPEAYAERLRYKQFLIAECGAVDNTAQENNTVQLPIVLGNTGPYSCFVNVDQRIQELKELRSKTSHSKDKVKYDSEVKWYNTNCKVGSYNCHPDISQRIKKLNNKVKQQRTPEKAHKYLGLAEWLRSYCK